MIAGGSVSRLSSGVCSGMRSSWDSWFWIELICNGWDETVFEEWMWLIGICGLVECVGLLA